MEWLAWSIVKTETIYRVWRRHWTDVFVSYLPNKNFNITAWLMLTWAQLLREDSKRHLIINDGTYGYANLKTSYLPLLLFLWLPAQTPSKAPESLYEEIGGQATIESHLQTISLKRFSFNETIYRLLFEKSNIKRCREKFNEHLLRQHRRPLYLHWR